MRFAQSVILLLLVALTPLGADTGPNEDSSARTQISRRLTETSASDGPQAMALIFLPQQQEIQLALSAGPEHLRLEATVYVFGKKGYEKIRSGKNGFTCMVNRDGNQIGDNDRWHSEKRRMKLGRTLTEDLAKAVSSVPERQGSRICSEATCNMIQRQWQSARLYFRLTT
ncbi:MAG: hypothetical protein DMF76_01000 [Acidobacteria bacterium]|nr:MAG: hypothetical protein DMF76_01000 [Acidobacteriota bacterium]